MRASIASLAAMRRAYRHTLPAEVQRSLEACWKEGVATQMTIAAFDYYLVPFGLFLGAGPQLIGLLAAAPALAAALAQLTSARMVRLVGGRLRVLIVGMVAQTATLIPIAALAVVAVPGRAALVVAAVALFRAIGSVIGPAWGSVVSDYLPADQRGQYFGWRARAIAFASIAAMALWGSVLALLETRSAALGFLVVFGGAAIFRAVALGFLARMVELPAAEPPRDEVPDPPPSGLTGWIWGSNFARFTLYVSTVTLATQFSAPFFGVRMLRDLHFDYLSYSAVQLASVVLGLLAFPQWGRHADVAGTARALVTTSALVPLIPLLWALADRPYQLVAIEMFAGFVWSGFNLATTNFIYDAAPSHERVRYLVRFNFVNGNAAVVGAWLGGLVAETAPPVLGSSLVTVFVLSGLLRAGAHFALAPRFLEVREIATPMSGGEMVLSVLGLRPALGRGTEPLMNPRLRAARRRTTRAP